MFKAWRLVWRGAARHLIRAALMMAAIMGPQGKAQAQTVTLNSPSAADLQALLQNGQTGQTNTIILNFTNTLVTTTPLFVTFPNTVVLATNTNAVFLSGNNTSQVFYVESGVKFTLENVTISGGNSTGAGGVNGANGSTGGSTGGSGTAGGSGASGLGGAIFNHGNTTLIDCSLLTNSATGGNGGNGGNGGSGFNFGGNGGGGGSGGAGYGGAIYNVGTLTLSNCTVAGNTATGGNGGFGGTNGSGSFAYSGPGGAGALGAGAGVYNAAGAVVKILACTFNNNLSRGGSSQAAGGAPNNGSGQAGLAGAAAEGAGLQNMGTANIVVNSTFSQNTVTGGNGGNGGNATTGAFAGAGGDGGAAYGGGIFNSSSATISAKNCTFYGGVTIGGTNGIPGTGSHTNSVGSPGVGYGANVVNNGGTFNIKNSLLTAPVGASNAYYASTAFVDQNNNISSDTTPAFTQPKSFNNTFPRLVPLAFNGGPTETMALQPGSPAIKLITDKSQPVFDQRGVLRSTTAASSGAFEFGGGVNFTISGQITPTTNNYTNVIIVAATPDFSYVTSPDANGRYSFSVLPGTYTVTPQATNGFSFNPTNLLITVGGTNGNATNENFVATPVFNLGGQISGLSSAVTVNIRSTTTTTTAQTSTDTNGNFIFTNLIADTYTITPQSTTYVFTPPNFTTNVPPSMTNIVFSANPTLSTVSGQIANIHTPVTIQVNNGSSNSFVLSSAAGSFTIPNLSAGTYFIQPLPTNGITFLPPTTNVTVPPDATLNFTAITTNQPSVSLPRITTNRTLQFSVSGVVSNLDYVIQASTNLSSPSNWVNIATNNSATNGAFSFTNSMTNSPQRFYRVIIP